MSYNTELQSNNADLQAILDAVNALPEAGGSGSGVDYEAMFAGRLDSSVVSVDIPDGITRLSNYALYGCNKMTSVKIPSSINSFYSYAFGGCSSLPEVDVPASVANIYVYAFSGCSALKTIILRRTSMVALSNANAFYNTPIASGNGYIFVPASLVDTYKADSKWSTFADQIRAIDGPNGGGAD